MKRLAVSALFVCVIAVLIALGTWQVERRAWKHALIARVEAGLTAPQVAAPVSAGAGDAYRRVVVRGRFLPDADSFVQASTVRGPGWWVLTPLVSEAGRTILVNRGYVSTRQASPPVCRSYSPPWKGGAGGGLAREGKPSAPQADPPPTSPFQGGEKCIVTGLIRLSEPGGGFLRSNDPVADRWYSRDVAAIAARRRISVLPYFIDADARLNRPGQPVGGLTVVRFSDNHLVYAITWYVLALMTLGGFLIWRRSA